MASKFLSSNWTNFQDWLKITDKKSFQNSTQGNNTFWMIFKSIVKNGWLKSRNLSEETPISRAQMFCYFCIEIQNNNEVLQRCSSQDWVLIECKFFSKSWSNFFLFCLDSSNSFQMDLIIQLHNLSFPSFDRNLESFMTKANRRDTNVKFLHSRKLSEILFFLCRSKLKSFFFIIWSKPRKFHDKSQP